MQVQVRVPGKLFLAGEYAVVEAGYPAIIAAVDRYLTIRITTADQGCIHSSQQEDVYLSWERQGSLISLLDTNPYPLITTAMQVTEDYLRSQGIDCQDYYRLDVQSDLDDQKTGAKYGLGSSGAVTVATVKAILTYYGQDHTPLLAYQLAAISQTKLGKTGSFGDLAASSFGGLIAYHSLDRSWLLQAMAEQSISELLSIPWKDLVIKAIDLPAELELLVGWTGSVASTDNLVSQLENHKSQADKDRIHKQFLEASKKCVEEFISGCQSGDGARVRKALSENRSILQDFSSDMGLVIETDRLRQLCDLAICHGAVAKSSGAGGGDCGICLVDSREQKVAIEDAWQQVDILPLPLNIANRE